MVACGERSSSGRSEHSRAYTSASGVLGGNNVEQEAVNFEEGRDKAVQQFREEHAVWEQGFPRGMYLDDGRDELEQEAADFEEGGVEVVQEVHDEALDVGAIMVLVRHDHQVPVAQLLCAVIHLRACAPIMETQPYLGLCRQVDHMAWHASILVRCMRHLQHSLEDIN